MIVNDDYNKCPQWMSNVLWNIRDRFFESSTEVKLVRTIIYTNPPLIDSKINDEVTMPDLTGYSGIDVIYNLKKSGYEVVIKFAKTGSYDENRVVSNLIKTCLVLQ